MSKFRSSSIVFLKVSIFIPVLLLFFIFLLPGYNFSYAYDLSSNNYQLTLENKLITLSATKADLKNILVDLAERTGISIRYPASLEKEITLNLDRASLKKALMRLLKDFNYSIIYSGSKKQAVISDVYIYEKDNNLPRTTQTNSNQTRITNRINSYERRIETLKESLSKVDENSSTGKRYLNQIKSYEKNIERLKSQLN